MNDESTDAGLAHFAELDFERAQRCGFGEVVFGPGKTPPQMVQILAALIERNGLVLATRCSAEQFEAVRAAHPDAVCLASCGLIYLDRRPVGQAFSASDVQGLLAEPGGYGQVVVCCAGTSDLRVAEEAACTARIMGSRTSLITDVGVAGVHRLLGHSDELQAARVIVAVAGMEGALPSVVAGLVKVPVLAVPTSVGYGASFGGLAALLAMLNSCSDGISVLNIDNGFGAGVVAHRINAPAWASEEQAMGSTPGPERGKR